MIEASSMNDAHISFFAKHFENLSNDLELPLEGKLPHDEDALSADIGFDPKFIEYRITSESKDAAFVLYYHHDENVHISLLLGGNNDEAELELMQIIRCLLLSPNFEEDIGEEEINEILDDDRFDFEEVEQRPVLYNVSFPSDDDHEAIQHIQKLDKHLAFAFFDRTD